LDSIWQQGLPEDGYEVICVDDCSKDKTVSVITEQQFEHSNLLLLRNKENLRAGGSRNQGVKNAHGEYILFIDADDYFHIGSLKKAFDYQQEYKLDILMCDYARQTRMNVSNDIIHNFTSKAVMSGDDFLKINSLPFGPCKYIFKKSLMTDNHIYFEEKVCCEDVDWTHKLVHYAQTMQYQPILLSHVVINESSQTANEYKQKKTVFDKLFAGYRVLSLSPLYRDENAKQYIYRVALSYIKQGLLYMNALYASPQGKKEAIRQYIPPDTNMGFFINTVRRFPLCYALFSNLMSPFFRMAIALKRKYFGR
jgi:glycosyltransferase involved in cell wall biosynthesis